MIILFGLLSQLEVLERATLSFNSSGSYVYELFGTKEININSEIKNSSYLSCRIRSNFTLTNVVEDNI
jgi:hypothetical protein